MPLLNYLSAAVVFYLVAVATAVVLFVLARPVFDLTRPLVFGSKRAVLARNYCVGVLQGACTLLLFAMAIRRLRLEPAWAMLVLPIAVFLFNRLRHLTPSQSDQITYAVGLQRDGIEFDINFYRPFRLTEMLGQLTGIITTACLLKLPPH